MAMKTVQIRLTEQQLADIDEKVKAGVYPNRSEAIRDYVRKAEFMELFNRFFEVTAGTSASEEDLDRVRQELWETKYKPRHEQEKQAA